MGLLAGAGLWLALVAPVQAASDAVDQSQQIATGANSLRTPMAQTFTAGVTGGLDRVSLMMATISGAVSATVQIQTVAGGKPSGTVLGSSSFSGSVNCCHAWHDFAFSPAVSLTSGTQYAIVVKPASGPFTWYDSFAFDTYTSGQMWLASGASWLYQTSFGRDFCFQTFVIGGGGTNQAPTLAAANTVVTADEGSPVSNSGTYSDPDGDAVTLSASSGTLTKTGTSSGSWSWSTPPADESPAQTITITATDSKAATTTVAFTVTIAGVSPTVTIAGAPASGPEGTAIALSGKATSPNTADTAAGFTMSWTVTKDGIPFATGTGAALSVTPTDEGAYVATLRAIDDGGNSATTAVSFTGANVAPTAVVSGVTHATLVLVALQPVTFSGGFDDPGALDTHTGVFDYGDGTPPESVTYPASGSGDVTDEHAYAAPGTYTVTYTVTDDDGGSGTATATVTVETPATAINKIDGYLQGISSLTSGEKSGLSAKLRAAIASAGRGDSKTTCNQLDAFMNELSALSKTGRVSDADATALGSAVWSVHRALGCAKVKIGWLTLTL